MSAQMQRSIHDEGLVYPAGLERAVVTSVPGATGPAVPVDPERFSLRFTGRGGEYFQIWIVNILLSMLTLGIYSAWAKVRRQRYFAGNTVLDGSAFEYHATGPQILVGRLVAVALLLLVTFGSALHTLVPLVLIALYTLISPWAIWRSVRFGMRMTGYRNVRFGFEGSLFGMYLYFLVIPLLPLLVGGAIASLAMLFDSTMAVALSIGVGVVAALAISPWSHKKLASYLLNGYRFGRARFAGDPSTAGFYVIYLKAIGIALLCIVAVGALAAYFSDVAIARAFSALAIADEDTIAAIISVAILVIYPLILLTGAFVVAFFGARLRAHLYAAASLDGRIGFESTQRARSLWWLMISNFLIRTLSGGLGAPWAKVRAVAYEVEHSVLHAQGGLGAFVDDEHARQSSFGEEVVDAFDGGLDVGF